MRPRRMGMTKDAPKRPVELLEFCVVVAWQRQKPSTRERSCHGNANACARPVNGIAGVWGCVGEGTGAVWRFMPATAGLAAAVLTVLAVSVTSLAEREPHAKSAWSLRVRRDILKQIKPAFKMYSGESRGAARVWIRRTDGCVPRRDPARPAGTSRQRALTVSFSGAVAASSGIVTDGRIMPVFTRYPARRDWLTCGVDCRGAMV